MSRPPSLFTYMHQPMHCTSCPKSKLKSTCLTAKFWKLHRTCGNGQKRTKMWSVLLSNIQFLWFLQSMLLLSYLYQWYGFCWQKSMQKSVTTVCLHCSFARLNNKHIGVLGTNVATISWLHWSPVSEYRSSSDRADDCQSVWSCDMRQESCFNIRSQACESRKRSSPFMLGDGCSIHMFADHLLYPSLKPLFFFVENDYYDIS